MMAATKQMRPSSTWLPHKIHFEVSRKLPPFERLIMGIDNAKAPLCGSPLRVLDTKTGSTTAAAKMTTLPRGVTCKRCLALLEKMQLEQ